MPEDYEDKLLRSVALQNAESIRMARQRAEQQAEATLREQANLLNLTHDAIIVRDMSRAIKYWNRGADELYGWTAEQAMGRDLYELLKTVFPVPFEQAESEVIRAGRWEGELVQTKNDGTQIVVASRWSLQRDDQGAPLVILVTNNDITARKRAEEELRAAMAERARLATFREEIGRALAHEGNLRGILHNCAEAAVRHLDAAFARIWTLTGNGRELELQASAGMYTRLDGSHSRVPVGQLKIGLIAQQRRPMLTNNVQNDPRVSDKEWARRKKMVAFAGYPLVVEDRAIGVMAMFSQKPLPEGTLEALSFVADSIAQGIERKRAEETLRTSEQRLRDVIDTIPAMVWRTLSDGSNDFTSRRWLDFTGAASEDVQGEGWKKAFHPADIAQHAEKWAASLATGNPFENEARVRRTDDGEYRWFLHRAVPLFDECGNILNWYGTAFDIEGRKRAEGLLAGEKRILEMVAKGASLPQILDSLCRLVEEQASGALASILLLEGNRLRHGGAPSLPKAYTDVIDGAVIGPSAGSCGTAAYRGEQVIVADIAIDPLWENYRGLALPHGLRACWSTPVFSSEGKVIATFAMYYREPRSPSPRDQEIIEQITHLAGVAIERKLAQNALRRSQGYLAEAQRMTHTGSWAWAPGGGGELQGWHYWSEEMFRIFEFDPRQGPPAPEMWWQRIHPEDRQQMHESLEKALAENGEYVNDYRILLPDGRLKYIHGIGHPVFNAGEIVDFVGTSVDLTEQKRTEEALRRSEAYLAEGQRLTHMGSWGLNIVTRQALHSSAEHTRLFGFDPEKGMPSFEEFLQRIHPEDQELVLETFRALMRSSGDLDMRYRVAVPSAPVRYLRAIGHPVLKQSGTSGEYVGITIDITERRRSEQERDRLRQLEADLAHINRVSMMGEMAASLAHEIKQPIAAAITNANTCLRWLARDRPDLEETGAAVSRMVKDATRAAEIINRVSLLYKKGAPQRELVDVNEVIQEMIVLLQNEATRLSISLRTDLAKGIPKVMADRVQLQQVLMNLMLNAIEAMKDTGGELTIKSQLGQEGQFLISVSDSGVGLPTEKTSQIFDPFFTTKPQGTGMGLAITRTIVESHGGRLWATANAGRGATFHFNLPMETALGANPAREPGKTTKVATTAGSK
jgi:PAS domain S-box-containing protein